MICKSCQLGGDLVAHTRKMDIRPNTVFLLIGWGNGDIHVGIQAAIRTVAHFLHGKCQGATHCDCQHKVDMEGKAINGR